MAQDPYQTFIDQLAADPDYPEGLVTAPLYAKGRVNFSHAKTDDCDQWQAAIEIDMPPDEALDVLVTEDEKARDRLRVQAAREARVNEERRVQNEFREAVRDITDAQKQRLQTKRDAIRQRHGHGRIT